MSTTPDLPFLARLDVAPSEWSDIKRAVLDAVSNGADPTGAKSAVVHLAAAIDLVNRARRSAESARS